MKTGDFSLMARIPESSKEYDEAVKLDELLKKERKMTEMKPFEQRNDKMYSSFVNKVKQGGGRIRQSSVAMGSLLGAPAFQAYYTKNHQSCKSLKTLSLRRHCQ
jgi:hypothetical protein